MSEPDRLSVAAFAVTSIVTLSLGSAVFAQIPSYGIETFQPPPDRRWANITTADVNAAFQILRENHPGAASELHDTEFVHRLGAARLLALRRATTAASYQGYTATLAGFATDMGDRHIWSHPTLLPSMVRWPGVVVSKQGQNWVVTDTDEVNQARLGDKLVSCDGTGVETLAQHNLGGFHADWSVGAQQYQSAPWLLVDEGNPFIERPKSCLFDKGGVQQTVDLAWTRIKRESFLPRIRKAGGAGAAGYGIRRVDAGFWIALEGLNGDQAAGVAKAVEAQKEALRQAPFVVLDLRGNGGGSSEIGRQIAISLMGEVTVDGALGRPSGSPCGGESAWRTSEDNIRHLDYLANSNVIAGGPEVHKMIADTLARTRNARDKGKAFSAPIDCPAAISPPPPPKQVDSLMRGRMVLLTDNLCFSSCLIVADNFRHLGALHVGQTTDAATHFIEVREAYLPSGYSLFSTLQAVVDPAGPARFGPFVPSLSYEGDISSTPAVEAWIAKIVSQPKGAA